MLGPYYASRAKSKGGNGSQHEKIRQNPSIKRPLFALFCPNPEMQVKIRKIREKPWIPGPGWRQCSLEYCSVTRSYKQQLTRNTRRCMLHITAFTNPSVLHIIICKMHLIRCKSVRSFAPCKNGIVACNNYRQGDEWVPPSIDSRPTRPCSTAAMHSAMGSSSLI